MYIPSEDGRPKSSNWVQASTSRSKNYSLVHRIGRSEGKPFDMRKVVVLRGSRIAKKSQARSYFAKKMVGLHVELFEDNDVLSIDEDNGGF